MPTILTHPVVASLKTWFPSVPARAYAFGAIATVLPDLDVIAFAAGIPYEHRFGHRGFSHSILFAALVASLFTFFVRAPRLPAFTFLFLCALSHPLLDAMTRGGGLGVAFFSPFSNVRYFFPWRPILVSPIGPRFFTPRGMATLGSEMVWVWLPMLGVALLGKLVNQARKT
ncbi:MAG TPA: metal-dependent hydrolase [Thermoanaerobaculia bacterium]|nr:metal-dependent hydrolase [Thermoanaerobaculia bacterium]